jgi:hypothetical protein
VGTSAVEVWAIRSKGGILGRTGSHGGHICALSLSPLLREHLEGGWGIQVHTVLTLRGRAAGGAGQLWLI